MRRKEKVALLTALAVIVVALGFAGFKLLAPPEDIPVQCERFFRYVGVVEEVDKRATIDLIREDMQRYPVTYGTDDLGEGCQALYEHARKAGALRKALEELGYD